jgi:hypothetical protein
MSHVQAGDREKIEMKKQEGKKERNISTRLRLPNQKKHSFFRN